MGLINASSVDRSRSRESPRRRPGGLARRAVASRLRRLQWGQITLIEDGHEETFGVAAPDAPETVRVEIIDRRTYARLAFGGSLGASEAYLEGFWSCDRLTDLFRVLMRNEAVFDGLDGGLARAAMTVAEQLHQRLRRNTRKGSERNIRAHYDLGNDLYQLFLDPTLTYSSAFFEDRELSLEEAQLAKYDRLCQKLALEPSDRVLEIGSGWGGFAIHAAGSYGCSVDTYTVSREQFELATKRVEQAGLSDRVIVHLRDYREIDGRYDKLVSIEMIEAVGHEYLQSFFEVCSRNLVPDGLMALQCITTTDQRYEVSVRSTDFIKRYIFPGGQLVSVGAIVGAMASATDLRMEHLEDMSPHYEETLRHWWERFDANRDAVRELGYPERFLRMWEFYLRSCEAAFGERYTGLAQIVLAKPLARRPPILGTLAAL